jgi:hypothetical protein
MKEKVNASPKKSGQKILAAIKKQINEAPKTAWCEWSNHSKR